MATRTPASTVGAGSWAQLSLSLVRVAVAPGPIPAPLTSILVGWQRRPSFTATTARPSGTENVYKIYAESFLGKEHLRRIQEEAQALISGTFKVATAVIGH